MKILHITHNYPSNTDNTEGIFLHRINRELSSVNDIKIILLKPGFRLPCVVESYKIDGVQVYKVSYFRPRGRIFNSLDGIFMLSARNKLPIDINEMDIIHSHWQTDGGVLGTHLAKKFNKPHIVSVRGARVFEKNKRTIYGLISDFVFKKANLIHTHGESIFQELQSKYRIPENKLIWIPNIIFNSNKLQRLLEANLKKPTQKEIYNFLFVGLNGKNKGLLDAINSFLSIKSQTKHLLTVVTDTTSSYFNYKIAPLVSHKKNIRILGKTKPQEVYQLFLKADVFLFPSFAEGLPNVVLEAMAAGCYIISYDIPALRKLIMHDVNGRLVPIHDETKLSEEVNNFVLNNIESEFQRYKNYNYNFIKERFDIRMILLSYNEMYLNLLTEEKDGFSVK